MEITLNSSNFNETIKSEEKILAFLLPAVARWGATFYSFRGIGEGGTAFPRESWSRDMATIITLMRICTM